jgi:hypothetical protein
MESAELHARLFGCALVALAIFSVVVGCGCIEKDSQIPYSQSVAPAMEGRYACITIGDNHTAFINGMKVSDGVISADGRSYTTPGDSEVEVITYKAANGTCVTYGKEADGFINYKDCVYDVVVTGDPELVEIVEVEVRDLKVVKFKAGSDLATKVK